MRQFSRAVSRSLVFLITAAIVGGCAGGGNFQKPDKRPGGTGVVGTGPGTAGSVQGNGIGDTTTAAATPITGENPPVTQLHGHETIAVSSSDIEDSEYRQGLTRREATLRESTATLATAKTVLTEAETSLTTAEANLQIALEAFAQAESGGDGDALDTAWAGVSSAITLWTSSSDNHDLRWSEYAEAEDGWQKKSIWLEQFKNDYEAQSSPFAVRDSITRCQTEECSADDFLGDERFTVFQPHVLEMVGVHHAYAKGLTGKDIRIGIEDDIVNFTLPEFAGRISFDGATLLYPVFDGDDFLSDASRCQRTGHNCRLITYSSEHQDLETLSARWTIAKHGWPAEGERWFIRNDYYEEGSLGALLGLRWREVPHGTSLGHGTAVASVAAGRDFGVAPGATVVPVAKDFRPGSQTAEHQLERSLLSWISTLSDSDRRVVDIDLASAVESEYAHFDVINRSYGIGVFDPASISAVLNDGTQWWGEGLRQILPQTWRAYMQTGTHPEDRTVVVYAAGNELEEFSGLGAAIPYHEPHVRGSQLSVMAVDHDGSHASYTNFCGALPSDWDTERWGRHFCLAAPGTVNSAGKSGKGFIVHEIEGTSFAAPVVSGAIALLMEHFRGQLGNTEIVKRLMNTANNAGRYAQLEIYGAGLLDLQAALQPVGELVTGTPSEEASTTSTAIRLPSTVGSLGRRLAARGVEVASLDSMGAPFWSSPLRLVHQTRNQSLIPDFAEPDWTPHRGFTPGVSAGPTVNGFQMLGGSNRIGLERAPREGFRWGVLGDTSSWMGGRASGAFGERVRSVTTWVGRGTQIELSNAFTLHGSATLGLGRVFLQSGGMLDVDAHVISAWEVGLEHGRRGGGTWSQLSLSQPLRAESGEGTLTYLSGLKDGVPIYDKATVPLAPESRELELALTHETPMGRGRGVVEMAYSWNVGHEPGQTQSRLGIAYRLDW